MAEPVTPAFDDPLDVRPGPAGVARPTQRARAGQVRTSPELTRRLTQVSERIAHTLRAFDRIVRHTNVVTIGADLDAARRDAAASDHRPHVDPTRDGLEVLDVLATLQQDTTQAVIGLDGVASILQDLDHLVRHATGAAADARAAEAPPLCAVSPTRADLRTLDGTARALGLQADSFQALATILDTIRDLMAELVRDPEVVAPAFGAEPSLVVEVAARSALAAHLTAIGFAHLRWRNELLRGIASRTEPAVQTDPAKCALGCWLDAYEAHGGEESAILAKLRPLHERLHQCAVGIIDDTRRGAAVHDLLDVVQREVTPCFAETWACLIQLIGGVQASAAAAVSLLRPAS